MQWLQCSVVNRSKCGINAPSRLDVSANPYGMRVGASVRCAPLVDWQKVIGVVCCAEQPPDLAEVLPHQSAIRKTDAAFSEQDLSHCQNETQLATRRPQKRTRRASTSQ